MDLELHNLAVPKALLPEVTISIRHFSGVIHHKGYNHILGILAPLIYRHYLHVDFRRLLAMFIVGLDRNRKIPTVKTKGHLGSVEVPTVKFQTDL